MVSDVHFNVVTSKDSRKPQKLDKRWILKLHDGKVLRIMILFDLHIPNTDSESVVGLKSQLFQTFCKGRSKKFEKTVAESYHIESL